MATYLSNNPTCVLTDADIYSESQKAKMAKNLMTGIPATSGEGDKVLVLDENGDPQLKDYSADGGGGSETPCIVDWANLTAEEIFSVVRTAIAANQPVFAKYQPVGYFSPYYYPLSSWSDNNGYTYVDFIGFQSIDQYSASGTHLFGAKEGPSANPEKVESAFIGNFVPATPEHAADGTTLQIQNGSMTWVAPN